MKQKTLFELNDKQESKYTKSVGSPLYEPKNKKPHILELSNRSKARRLINKINESNVSDEEKKFLIGAAQRHVVFNYESIADYYSHASKDMQKLMEDSALVIIDFEKAIELGYVQLSNEIRTQYLEEYGE
mgnify:FL=1|tara:strand:- start:4683 stop:5072 length:390 start_codon:yes stop_codon:yes gene_type:complete